MTITLDSLVTNMVSVDFDVSALSLPPILSFIFDEQKVYNPLNADLVLEVVQSDAV